MAPGRSSARRRPAPPRPWDDHPVRIALRLLAAAGLAVDAWAHADLAASFDANTASISQGNLFRVEAAASALAALAVLLSTSRVVHVVAFLIAASALGAVLFYRYDDVGTLGPLPNMYEPIWYPEKVLATIAEAVAALTLLTLVILPRRRPQPNS